MSLIDFAERGLLPDALIRHGIRQLCRQRLQDEGIADAGSADARFNQLIAELKSSPIAIETQAANEQHYELPTEFFQLCLGKRLKYSSAASDVYKRQIIPCPPAPRPAPSGRADNMRKRRSPGLWVFSPFCLHISPDGAAPAFL